MAKTENRDGDDVTGEYSYVDALGQLVTVTYTAGAMGYSETREVTPNFLGALGGGGMGGAAGGMP